MEIVVAKCGRRHRDPRRVNASMPSVNSVCANLHKMRTELVKSTAQFPRVASTETSITPMHPESRIDSESRPPARLAQAGGYNESRIHWKSEIKKQVPAAVVFQLWGNFETEFKFNCRRWFCACCVPVGVQSECLNGHDRRVRCGYVDVQKDFR